MTMKGNINGNTGLKGMILLACAALLFSSCEEFQPVFTGKYREPEAYTPFDPADVSGNVLTVKELSQQFIAEAAARGQSSALKTWCWEVSEDLWVKGRITTTDQPGNFYKSFYIQDDADGPGLEIKAGRVSLNNDYKVGQEVYVSLDGLAVGEYGYKSGNYGGQGTIQVGLKDPEQSDYSTAYIENQYIVNNHIFRCDVNDIDEIEPRVITSLPSSGDCQATSDLVGALVTIKGMKYADKAFALLYIRSTQSTDESANRIFLSDKTWGITTWAMSKNKFIEYVESGIWDSAKVGNSGQLTGETLADVKGELLNNAGAYAVSQYFTGAGGTVQIRTSGYSKFADLEIDPKVLSGDKSVTATGILTMYQGGVQLVLRDQSDIVIE